MIVQTNPEIQVKNLMRPSAWLADSLRKTYFFEVGAKSPIQGLWKEVVGKDPTDSTVKPLASLVSETGDWKEGCKLSLSAQPGRVDLILHPDGFSNEIPNVGEYFAVLDDFKKLNLPESYGLPIRVAFGASAVISKLSHADCYESLGQWLGHINIDPKSREFQYRINNPLMSVVAPDVEINCISAWAAIRISQVVVGGVVQRPSDKFAVKVELDVSTQADKDVSMSGTAQAFFDELYAAAAEVLTSGAKP